MSLNINYYSDNRSEDDLSASQSQRGEDALSDDFAFSDDNACLSPMFSSSKKPPAKPYKPSLFKPKHHAGGVTAAGSKPSKAIKKVKTAGDRDSDVMSNVSSQQSRKEYNC